MAGALLEHLLVCRVSMLLLRSVDYPADGSIQETVVPTDRLIYLRQGQLRYRTEAASRDLAAGALWLVPAWTRRSWQVTSPEPCTIAWVELVILGSHEPTPFCVMEQAQADMQQAMSRIMMWGMADDPAPRLLAEMELKRVLAVMVQQGRDNLAVSDQKLSAVRDPSLGHAMALMRDHLDDPALLARLPGRLGLSPARLRTRFAQVAGMSPGRFLHRLRMEQARYLLLTTELSVKEIAARTGFEDALYFSRRYRQFWGRPATQDRAPSP